VQLLRAWRWSQRSLFTGVMTAQSPTAADIASLAQRCSRTVRFPVPGVDVPYERKEIPP
jgi:hypothetical protein